MKITIFETYNTGSVVRILGHDGKNRASDENIGKPSNILSLLFDLDDKIREHRPLYSLIVSLSGKKR